VVSSKYTITHKESTHLPKACSVWPKSVLSCSRRESTGLSDASEKTSCRGKEFVADVKLLARPLALSFRWRASPAEWRYRNQAKELETRKFPAYPPMACCRALRKYFQSQSRL
jgi:hypothetical protein